MTQSQSKHHEVIIAGHGGQGVILVGKLLAQVAMLSGYQVTYMPSYGAEMRGGTAKCMIVIDTDPIDNPLVVRPDSIIVMNQVSCDKFSACLKPKGLLVSNSTLVHQLPDRTDIRVREIPADETANKLGSIKSSNMVALGGWLKSTGCISPQQACDCLKDVLAKRYHHLIPLNEQAILRGAELAG